jgi:8-oxo-dGTP pyrophosphatase MutT (NUDIX family)
MNNDMTFAAGILIITKDNFVLTVRDPSKKHMRPYYDGVPSGNGDLYESPIDCALRETFEETWLELPVEKIRLLEIEDRGDPKFPHQYYMFICELNKEKKDIPLANEGLTGEIPSWKSIPDILCSNKFVPEQYKLVKSALLERIGLRPVPVSPSDGELQVT